MRTSKRAFTCTLMVVIGVAGCGGSMSAPGNGGGGGSLANAGGSGAIGAPGTSDAGVDAAPAGPPTYAMTFSTVDTSQYLSGGSDGTLVASANSAGATETFTLTDVNGGALAGGDVVYLALAGKYLSAANGGGGALAFAATTPGEDETFTIVRVDGAGTIAPGDHVAFMTKVTSNYVSAVNGGGGQVLANQTHDEAWETYTMAMPATGGDGGVASSARDKVLAYLKSIQGKQAAIGIEDKDASNPTADSDQMASIGGDGYPS
ncbi:MAG TPA: hypothetical protein VIA18_31900, partial [Polyangia bacterium]|nr:hypothetical protein [Polyangia bacterium]